MLEYILLATCIVLQFTCIIQCCKAKDAAERAEDAFARLTLSFSGLSAKLGARLNELEALMKSEAEKPPDTEPTEQERIEAGIANILAYGEAQMRKRPGDVT